MLIYRRNDYQVFRDALVILLTLVVIFLSIALYEIMQDLREMRQSVMDVSAKQGQQLKKIWILEGKADQKKTDE